jgi:hypothetical protein
VWTDVAERVGAKSLKSILRGDHLITHGMKPSPHFGTIIKAAVAAQDEGLFTDEKGALEWLNTVGKTLPVEARNDTRKSRVLK